MQFKKWATKTKMRASQEPLDVSTIEKDLLGVFNLCKSPYPTAQVPPRQRREAFNRLDKIVLMVTKAQYKQLDVKVLLWSAIGNYCYFRQTTNQRWRYGWRDHLLLDWLRFDLRSARFLLTVMRRVLAERNQSEAAIASITLNYINEYSLWPREALVVRVLLRTLVAGIPGAIVLNLLLDSLLLDVGLPAARHIVRVIYELFDFYDWPQLDQRAGKAITRLLKIYRKALWIEYNSSAKASEQLECSAMRKGLEVAIRRMCEHMLNCDLMLVISYMIDWVFDSRNTEEIILTFGTVLEHIAIIHETHSYSETFQSNLFEHILELVGSSTPIVCRLGNRILQHLIDRHDNRREFQVPRIYFQNSHFNVNVAHCQISDKEFFKKYRKKFHYKIMCAVLQHGENRQQLLSLYSTLCLVATEIPCSYMAVVMANIGINVQGVAINVVDIPTITRYHLHAFTVSIMSLLCWLFNAPDLYKYVNKLINMRAEQAPHLNPPIQREYTMAQHHVLWDKEEMFFDVWEVRYSLWMRFRIKHAQTYLESMDATGPPTRSEILLAAESGVEPSLVARVHHPTRRILLRPFLPPRHECLPPSAVAKTSPDAAYDADPRLLEYLIEEPTALRLSSGWGYVRGAKPPATPKSSFGIRKSNGKEAEGATPVVDKKASVSSARLHPLASIQQLNSKSVSPKEESEPSAREKEAAAKSPKEDSGEHPPLSSGFREAWNESEFPAKKMKPEKQPKDEAKTKDGGDLTTGSSKGLSLSDVIRRVFGSKVKKKSKPIEMKTTESMEGSPRGSEQNGSLQLQIWEESDKAPDSEASEASAEAASETTTGHPDEAINVKTKPPIDDASGETKGSTSETSQKPSHRPSPKSSVSETGDKVVPTTKSLSNSTEAPSTTSKDASKEPAASQINTIPSEVVRKVSPKHSSTNAPIPGAAVGDSLGEKGNVTEVVTANKIGALSKPTKIIPTRGRSRGTSGGRRSTPGMKQGTARPASARGPWEERFSSHPGRKTAKKAAASGPPGSTDAPLAATTGTDIVPSTALTVDETTAKEELHGHTTQQPSRGATVIDLSGDKNKSISEGVAAFKLEDTTEPSNENPKGETITGPTAGQTTTETPTAPVSTLPGSATTTAFTGSSAADEPAGTPQKKTGTSTGLGEFTSTGLGEFTGITIDTPSKAASKPITRKRRGFRKRSLSGSRERSRQPPTGYAAGDLSGDKNKSLSEEVAEIKLEDTTEPSNQKSIGGPTLAPITEEDITETYPVPLDALPGSTTTTAFTGSSPADEPAATPQAVRGASAGRTATPGMKRSAARTTSARGRKRANRGPRPGRKTANKAAASGPPTDAPLAAITGTDIVLSTALTVDETTAKEELPGPSQISRTVTEPGKLNEEAQIQKKVPAGPCGTNKCVVKKEGAGVNICKNTIKCHPNTGKEETVIGKNRKPTTTTNVPLTEAKINSPSKAPTKSMNRSKRVYRKHALSAFRKGSRQWSTGNVVGDSSGEKSKYTSEGVAVIQLEDTTEPSDEKSMEGGGFSIAPTTGETITYTFPIPLDALTGSASTTAFSDSSPAVKAAGTPQADAGRGVIAGKTLESPSKAASKPSNRRKGFRKRSLSGSRERSRQPPTGYAAGDMSGDKNKSLREEVAEIKLDDTTEPSNENPKVESTTGVTAEATTETPIAPVATHTRSATRAFPGSSAADMVADASQAVRGASPGRGATPGKKLAAARPATARGRKRAKSGSVPGKKTAKKAAADRQIETTSPSNNGFSKRGSLGKVAETNSRPSNVGIAKASSQSDIPTGDASGDVEVSTPANSINTHSPALAPRTSISDRTKEKRTKQADDASANKNEQKSSPSFGSTIPTRKQNKRGKRPLRQAPLGRPGAMNLTGTSTRSPRSPKPRTSVGKKTSAVESLSGIPKRSSSVVKKEASFQSIDLSSIPQDFDLSKTSRDQSIDNVLHGLGVMGGPSTTKAKGHETARKMGSTPGTKTNVTTGGFSKQSTKHLHRSSNRSSTRVKSAHGAKAEATSAPQTRINKKLRTRVLKESVTRKTVTTNADSYDSSSSESFEIVPKSAIRGLIGSSVMAGRSEETIGSKDNSSDDSSIKGMVKGASKFKLEMRAGSAFRARDRSINHPRNSSHDGATAVSRGGPNKSSNQASATSGSIEPKALRRKESKKSTAMIPKTKRGTRRFSVRPSPATTVTAAINQNMGLPVAPSGKRYSLALHGAPRVSRRSGAPSGEIIDASANNLGTIAMKLQPTEKPEPSTPVSTPSEEATTPLSTVNNPNQIKKSSK